jgi:hypothetical protein
LQAATLPLAVAGGPGLDAAVTAVPNRAYAAKLFENVMADAKDVPVSLSKSGDAILRVKELADAGTSMPQSIQKLLNRVTKPGSKPLTYSEARDFYSNITRLSADEAGRLNPIMKKQIGIVTNALKTDIGEAAGRVGQMGNYYAALQDYAKASQLLRAATTIGKEIGIPLAKIAAAGAAAKAGWDIAARR